MSRTTRMSVDVAREAMAAQAGRLDFILDTVSANHDLNLLTHSALQEIARVDDDGGEVDRQATNGLSAGEEEHLMGEARRSFRGGDDLSGLLAGFRGGWIDAVLMRLCDVMLSFPAILVALLIAGVGRALFPNAHESLAFGVLILSISLTGWVQYARTVRGSTLVERNKEYVQAARVTGVAPLRIMRKHVLPNVMGPVMVLATIQVATAIITEATLSFLGVGAPPTSPSLGTLIRIGNDYLFSGEWWITIFPGVMLVVVALSVNLLGDWLRDALNPRLR